MKGKKLLKLLTEIDGIVKRKINFTISAGLYGIQYAHYGNESLT